MFPANPTLSYPHFESYRLSSAEVTATSVPLPAEHVCGAYASDRVFGVKETKAKAAYEWVRSGVEEDEVVYVDKAGGVIIVKFGNKESSVKPTYITLTTLPTPIASGSSIPSEYPSVVAIRAAGNPTYLASAGDGVLHVITRQDGSFVTTEHDIPGPEARYPFIIHAAREQSTGIQVIVSRTIRTADGTSFEVSAVDVSLDGGEVRAAWTLKGEEHVAYVHWVEDEWIIAGSEAFVDPSVFEERKDNNPQSTTKPTTSPFVPTTDQEASEYPYTWTQTHDSVTVTFNLTFATSQNDKTFDSNRDLLCVIHADNLNLRFPDHGTQPTLSPSQRTFFSRVQWDWWDSVRAGRGESTWTFEWTDRDAGKGKLEIELGKRNAGVRWASVFAPQDDLEVEVPETLSEGQVAETTDRMAKWTDESQDPQLLPRDEEDDFEFDDDPAFSGSVAVDANDGSRVGARLVFTTIASTGDVTPSTEPAWALSTELAGPSVILKSHVDGQLFTPTSSGWNHTSTSPALSFVLASKRDTQYVHHLSTPGGAVVVAFESSRPDGTGGNAYVYWPVEDTGEKTKSGKSAATVARQAVVKFVRGDEVGMLMGVARVVVGGKTVVVGLCERGWAVLEGL